MGSENDFKFRRDFSKINWKVTLQVNLIRAACAGPVLGLLLSLQDGNPRQFFTYALFFPVMYLCGLLPMALIAGFLGSIGVPFVGIFSFFLSFMVAIGDPLAFIIYKKWPTIIPVKHFGLFNFSAIIFITDSEEDESEIVDEEEHVVVQTTKFNKLDDIQEESTTEAIYSCVECHETFKNDAITSDLLLCPMCNGQLVT